MLFYGIPHWDAIQLSAPTKIEITWLSALTEYWLSMHWSQWQCLSIGTSQRSASPPLIGINACELSIGIVWHSIANTIHCQALQSHLTIHPVLRSSNRASVPTSSHWWLTLAHMWSYVFTFRATHLNSSQVLTEDYSLLNLSTTLIKEFMTRTAFFNNVWSVSGSHKKHIRHRIGYHIEIICALLLSIIR